MISRVLDRTVSLHYVAHVGWLVGGALFGEGVSKLLVRQPRRHGARAGVRR